MRGGGVAGGLRRGARRRGASPCSAYRSVADGSAAAAGGSISSRVCVRARGGERGEREKVKEGEKERNPDTEG